MLLEYNSMLLYHTCTDLYLEVMHTCNIAALVWRTMVLATLIADIFIAFVLVWLRKL